MIAVTGGTFRSYGRLSMIAIIIKRQSSNRFSMHTLYDALEAPRVLGCVHGACRPRTLHEEVTLR